MPFVLAFNSVLALHLILVLLFVVALDKALLMAKPNTRYFFMLSFKEANAAKGFSLAAASLSISP